MLFVPQIMTSPSYSMCGRSTHWPSAGEGGGGGGGSSVVDGGESEVATAATGSTAAAADDAAAAFALSCLLSYCSCAAACATACCAFRVLRKSASPPSATRVQVTSQMGGRYRKVEPVPIGVVPLQPLVHGFGTRGRRARLAQRAGGMCGQVSLSRHISKYYYLLSPTLDIAALFPFKLGKRTNHRVLCTFTLYINHYGTAVSAQRAAATNSLRAEVKLVTCAQLSEAGS